MSRDNKQKQRSFGSAISSTLFAVILAIGLGACTHDNSKSSSGGGSISTIQDPNRPGQANEATATIACLSISSRGILWKPVSEGDGNLVVLLSSGFGDPAVFVIDTKGNAIERGDHRGRSNGNRATYRFRRPGAHFSSPSVLQIGQGSTARFFCVPNTGRRWE
ncbi:MAG: hypothetical protein ACI8P9_002597 [Parasphingorhabdus sp.]|jgi:hypothetical protein